MKKGIVYNLFKIGNTDLTICIKELNLSSKSAKEYDYPKCLLLSNKVNDKERDAIEIDNFDIIVEYEQEFDDLSDKLLAFKYTPFEKNILIDSDILFLNERWYDFVKPTDHSLMLDIPDFSLEHLFDQTFALTRASWFFKKTVIRNNIAHHTYIPEGFEELFKKYNDRSNTFIYNSCVTVFNKSDEKVKTLFNEALENAKYLSDLFINKKMNFRSDDQIALCFAIKHTKVFPSYIHSTFAGSLIVKDNNFCISEPLIMAHSPDAMKYIIDTAFKLPTK